MGWMELIETINPVEIEMPEERQRDGIHVWQKERCGMMVGRCAQCGELFEYYGSFHQWKISTQGKTKLFCRYSCMRVQERELLAQREEKKRRTAEKREQAIERDRIRACERARQKADQKAKPKKETAETKKTLKNERLLDMGRMM